MIDIRKYLEDNHIEPPKGMSENRFIKIIQHHLPFAYDAVHDDVKAIELAIRVIKKYGIRSFSKSRG